MIQKDFVGVVCQREEQAIRAAKELRVTWNDPGGVPTYEEFYAQMESQVGQSRLAVNDGDVDKALAGAAKVLEATYYYPYQLHGSMGPSCAIADVRSDEITVWSPTQGVYPLRSAVARMLGYQEQNVHVIYKEGSGCYGLNGADTASLDAALMSKHVGQPVRVQWMRHDEHVWEHFGNPMVMKVRGGLDANGELIAWDYNSWSAGTRRQARERRCGEPAHRPPHRPDATDPPTNRAPVFPPLGSDTSNTVAGYLRDEQGKVPNARVVSRSVRSPFFTGPLRSPARIQNSFANESFIDELAAAAKADPVEYRLRYVGDPRLRDAITVAAKAADWETRPSPKANRTGKIVTGRGIAAMQYEGIDGYAGSVVELEVNRTTGKIRVTRVVCSHDVGIIINPDGIRAQLEGNVVHGISRALMEEVSFSRKAATTTNFESYQVMRFTDLPEIKFALINRTSQPPKGVGREPDDGHPRRGRQRDLRRDGRADAAVAVHARPREGGAEVGRKQAAARGSPSPGRAALGHRLLDEPAREGEEGRVVDRRRWHGLVEHLVEERRGDGKLDLDLLREDSEEAAHGEARCVVHHRHAAREPARGPADHVDVLGPRRRVGGDVAVALVLQELDVHPDGRHGRARERRRELHAVALVELGEHRLERGERCDDGLLAGEHRQREEVRERERRAVVQLGVEFSQRLRRGGELRVALGRWFS